MPTHFLLRFYNTLASNYQYHYTCPYNLEYNLKKYNASDHDVKQVARQRANLLIAISPLGVELVIL